MRTDYVWQIVIVLITVLLTSFAGYVIGSQPEKVHRLEYEVFKNENISKNLPDIESIEILHNGEKIENLSNAAIMVRNNSTKNLENVEVHFRFRDSEIRPIYVSTHPPLDRPKESVTLLSQGKHKYIYKIDDINISKDGYSGYLFYFHFASKKPPEIDVLTSGKGITIEEQVDDQPSAISYFHNILIRTWWLLVLYGVIFFLYIKFITGFKTLKKEHIRNVSKDTTRSLSPSDIVSLSEYSPGAFDVVKHLLKTRKNSS